MELKLISKKPLNLELQLSESSGIPCQAVVQETVISLGPTVACEFRLRGLGLRRSVASNPPFTTVDIKSLTVRY